MYTARYWDVITETASEIAIFRADLDDLMSYICQNKFRGDCGFQAAPKGMTHTFYLYSDNLWIIIRKED